MCIAPTHETRSAVTIRWPHKASDPANEGTTLRCRSALVSSTRQRYTTGSPNVQNATLSLRPCRLRGGRAVFQVESEGDGRLVPDDRDVKPFVCRADPYVDVRL